MADISFRPTRRYKISFLPASVSKYQELPLCINGMGVGQFSAPIIRQVVPSGSFLRRCISRYFCTKFARLWASSTSSPDETTCFPSAPRISTRAFSSLLSSTATSASLASSGDENVFWPCCCAMERVGKHTIRRMATAANSGRLAQRNPPRFSFARRIGLLSNSKFHNPLRTPRTRDYGRPRPPPPRPPPPRNPPPPKLALPCDEKLLVCPPWS